MLSSMGFTEEQQSMFPLFRQALLEQGILHEVYDNKPSFFRFLKAVNTHCFATIFAIPQHVQKLLDYVITNGGVQRLLTVTEEENSHTDHTFTEAKKEEQAEGQGQRAALVAFHSDAVHAQDLTFFLDQEGVAVRSGHHCTQPLHRELGIASSTRASLYLYNSEADIEVFIEKLKGTLGMFSDMEEGGAATEE